MEFLKLVRKRSFISELVYMGLNIALAVAVLLVVRYTDSIWFAIALVLLSKWRVFAVRPRYWWANLRANMVDFIVSISVVLHLNTINMTSIADGSKVWLMIGLTLLYIGWLLFIKPRSKRSFMAAQAGIALFMGMSALFTISYSWPVSLVAGVAWLIGYTAARHILSSYDEETHGLFLSLVWGLVVAELAWIGYHWAIAYPLPLVSSLMVPQIALIVTLLGFLGYK
ncbi:hypothetical protein LRY29_02050, partial [Candidatus Saccharibacteria bacterium]|nr:hypothetical protein [Candidatus Saccharibacteria bacterium]